MKEKKALKRMLKHMLELSVEYFLALSKIPTNIQIESNIGGISPHLLLAL